MGTIEMRSAVEKDAEAIHEVHVASIREICATHYTAGQVRSWLDTLSPDRCRSAMRSETMIVADDGTGIVAFGSLAEKEGEIRAVYVHPDHVGSGIGMRVLRRLEDIAASAGLENLSLRSSLNAVGFYRRAGYGHATAESHPNAACADVPCIGMRKRLPGSGA